jgi:enoyl-CoA hydratase
MNNDSRRLVVITVLQLHVQDGVASMVLDRPPVNAWNDEQLDLFEDALRAISERSDIAVVVVRGGGSHFSAGGDIKVMASALRNGQMAELNNFAARIQHLFNEWAELAVPTIAVLRGAATGGGLELALACDLRVASDTSTIGLPEVKLGLVPAGGGTQRLTRLIGRGRALRLMLTGELVSGVQAERLGIVEWSFPDSELDGHVERLLTHLVEAAGPAHAAIKRCVALAGTGEGYGAETHYQRQLHKSPETLSRLRTFVSERERSNV